VNGSTPVHPLVQAVMLEAQLSFGNAAAAHPAGQRTRAAIDNARRQIASAINAQPDEIWFTSGGSGALRGALAAGGAARNVAGDAGHLA
jgi:cysteine desulfurase